MYLKTLNKSWSLKYNNVYEEDCKLIIVALHYDVFKKYLFNSLLM